MSLEYAQETKYGRHLGISSYPTNFLKTKEVVFVPDLWLCGGVFFEAVLGRRQP
jgi:hypothetical protein